MPATEWAPWKYFLIPQCLKQDKNMITYYNEHLEQKLIEIISGKRTIRPLRLVVTWLSLRGLVSDQTSAVGSIVLLRFKQLKVPAFVWRAGKCASSIWHLYLQGIDFIKCPSTVIVPVYWKYQQCVFLSHCENDYQTLWSLPIW